MAGEITPEQARAELARRRAQSANQITPEMARAELERRRQAKADPYPNRSTILPLSRNAQTGEIDFTMPGLLKGIFDSGQAAITAPGRAMRGELQVMGDDGRVTPEAIGEGANMAAWLSPTSPARSVLQPAAPRAVPRPERLDIAEAASRQGVDLPRAVVSDNMAVQQTGKVVASVPVLGNPLRKASQTAIGQLDDVANRTQAAYGRGNTAYAGSMIRDDLTNTAKNALPARVAAKYDVVDSLVTPNIVTPLSNTRRVADDIVANRMNANIPGDSQAVAKIRQAATNEQGLNYEGIKQLRTYIGEFLDDPQKLSASGMSKAELKRIYGALTEDLKTSVSKNGPQALKAWQAANGLAERVAKDRQALQRIVGKNKSDEAIVSTLESMAGSTSRADISNLVKARRSVSPETWDEFSSAVLARLGRDAEGNFSPDRFVTAYGKLSNQGKAVLFRGQGKGDLASSLDDIATISSRFKSLNEFANPSGSAMHVIGPGMIAGMYAEPMTALGTMVSTATLARALSKPVTARKIANWTKAYERAARSGTPAARKALEVQTRALITDIGGARPVAPSLYNAGPVPAEPNGENPNRMDQVE